MSEETYEDLKEIVQLTGNTNKTDIIGTALRLYRELLEFKGEKDGKLSIETKSDQRHIRADLSI